MARTVRRKTETHEVGTEHILIDNHYAGTLRLFGSALRLALKEYRRDGSKTWHRSRPPKLFRKFEYEKYRTWSKREIKAFIKNPEYEVLLLNRIPYDYWD